MEWSSPSMRRAACQHKLRETAATHSFYAARPLQAQEMLLPAVAWCQLGPSAAEEHSGRRALRHQQSRHLGKSVSPFNEAPAVRSMIVLHRQPARIIAQRHPPCHDARACPIPRFSAIHPPAAPHSTALSVLPRPRIPLALAAALCCPVGFPLLRTHTGVHRASTQRAPRAGSQPGSMETAAGCPRWQCCRGKFTSSSTAPSPQALY